MLILRLALLGVALAVALPKANGQTADQDPKKPGLSIETQGNFKNIQSIDPDLAKQAQDLASLQRIPTNQNATVVPWLIANSVGLSPPFLLELARRLWDMDRRNDAFEWYALAFVRARYDSGRCVDPTAQQPMLPPIAVNVARGIAQYRSAFGEAGLRAIARPDAFSGTASPWWVCSRGMAAIKAGLENRSIEQSEWLKPRNDWDLLRTNITRDLTAFFTEQGKPQDDPIPMSKTAYKTTTIGVGDYNDFVWLDEQRLIFGEWSHDGSSRSLTTILRQWRMAAPIEEVARFTGPWCAGKGVVAYIVNHGGQNGKPRQVTFAVGEPGKTTENVVQFESYARYAKLMHDDSRGKSFSTDPKRQSPFDCRWVTSNILTGDRNDTEWIPLLPGDGFLSFNAPNGGPADRITYYSKETSAPMALPIPARDVAPHAVRYFDYKRAYFISPSGIRWEQVKDSKCVSVWWFFPEDARTEEICVPVDAANMNFPTYWPSRAGILRVVSRRRTPHGEKPGGIYLTAAEDRIEKLFEGRVRAVSVSPEGCRVAVDTYPETPSFGASANTALAVIDLCTVDQRPGAATAR